jgi:hypothetical protein
LFQVTKRIKLRDYKSSGLKGREIMKMLRRKVSVSQSETMTEDERSSTKNGFFSNWFGPAAMTDTRDESEFTYFDGDASSADSIDNQYPTSNKHEGQRENYECSFDQTESEGVDSLAEFERDLQIRHTQACKLMRVSAFVMRPYPPSSFLQSTLNEI